MLKLHGMSAATFAHKREDVVRFSVHAGVNSPIARAVMVPIKHPSKHPHPKKG